MVKMRVVSPLLFEGGFCFIFPLSFLFLMIYDDLDDYHIARKEEKKRHGKGDNCTGSLADPPWDVVCVVRVLVFFLR
jgi:hypothetical protein